jgi:tetratricopeptide (TPR) repeat protein
VSNQAAISLSFGILCARQGDVDAAIRHLTKCIELARQHDLRELLLAGQSSLADLYLHADSSEKAEPLLVESERMGIEMKNRYQLQEIYRGWALLRLADGDITAALDYSERALTIANDLKMAVEQGIGWRVRGQALLAAGQSAEAQAAFEQSHTLLMEKDPYETARTQIQLGRVLLAGDIDRDRGRELLKKARATCKRLGAQRQLDEIIKIETH